jgi:hypothetical protein
VAKYNSITSDPSRAYSRYASVSFDLANTVDYDVKANTTLFDRTTVARVCMIRSTMPIYVKLNSTDDDPIEFFSNDGFNFGLLPVENIFITAAEEAHIRIVTIGYN